MILLCFVVSRQLSLLRYHAPPYDGIKRFRDPSVRLSVSPACLGQLGAQRLGQGTRAVRIADPSAHGRRSQARTKQFDTGPANPFPSLSIPLHFPFPFPPLPLPRPSLGLLKYS